MALLCASTQWSDNMYNPLPLHHTCYSLVLVLSGASVNTGREGDSPLHEAVRQESLVQVSVLLDYGADVNLRDSNNQRAVDLAPAGGKIQELLSTFDGSALSCATVNLSEMSHSILSWSGKSLCLSV